MILVSSFDRAKYTGTIALNGQFNSPLYYYYWRYIGELRSFYVIKLDIVKYILVL